MQREPELDSLLRQVIADANAKGAYIAGIKMLSNGKAVLYPETSRYELPKYYGSRYCLIDSLIHRFNLKKRYAYLYQRHQNTTEKTALHEHENGLTQEAQAIERCDAILRHHNHYELLGPDRHHIYSALSQLLGHSMLRRKSFGNIKSALGRHYRRKIDDAFHIADKVKLKQIVRFFDDLEYHDLA